jgi:hypothetical protein
MKVRHGFVSNSSSTSFLLSKGGFKNIFDLAEKMVMARQNEGHIDSELVKKIRVGMDEIYIDRNYGDAAGIAFRTCNYDTFIVPVGNYYVVATCNNHGWSCLDHALTYITPSEVVDELERLGLSRTELTNDFREYIESNLGKINANFWFPEYGLFASVPKEYPGFCKEHYCNLLVPAGETKPICLDCLVLAEKNKAPTQKTEMKEVIIEPGCMSRCPFANGSVSVVNNTEVDIQVQISEEK